MQGDLPAWHRVGGVSWVWWGDWLFTPHPLIVLIVRKSLNLDGRSSTIMSDLGTETLIAVYSCITKVL